MKKTRSKSYLCLEKGYLISELGKGDFAVKVYEPAVLVEVEGDELQVW